MPALTLDAFNTRYQSVRNQIDACLAKMPPDAYASSIEMFTKHSLKLIECIEDNEILVNLHDYLTFLVVINGSHRTRIIVFNCYRPTPVNENDIVK